MNPFLDLLLALVKSYSGPTPQTRANRLYKQCYERASATTDWDSAPLVTAMKDKTIPGAFHESPTSMFSVVLAAWRKQMPPAELKRLL